MDNLQASLQNVLDGKIDFEGQQLAEKIIRYSIPVLTAISFIVGFLLQSMEMTFYVLGFTTFLVALIVIPQWPPYNKHPVKWLPAKAKTE